MFKLLSKNFFFHFILWSLMVTASQPVLLAAESQLIRWPPNHLANANGKPDW